MKANTAEPWRMKWGLDSMRPEERGPCLLPLAFCAAAPLSRGHRNSAVVPICSLLAELLPFLVQCDAGQSQRDCLGALCPWRGNRQVGRRWWFLSWSCLPPPLVWKYRSCMICNEEYFVSLFWNCFSISCVVFYQLVAMEKLVEAESFVPLCQHFWTCHPLPVPLKKERRGAIFPPFPSHQSGRPFFSKDQSCSWILSGTKMLLSVCWLSNSHMCTCEASCGTLLAQSGRWFGHSPASPFLCYSPISFLLEHFEELYLYLPLPR